MWCTYYRQMKQDKLPTECIVVYDEDTICDFDPNLLEIGIKSSEVNMKDDSTITSNIDNEMINFRVKLYELTDFDRKIESWLYFKASF